MVEAQLNIYHHFCSQTVAWGPNQLEVHVLAVRSDAYRGRDSGTHSPCLASALREYVLTAHRRKGGKAAHRGERGRWGGQTGPRATAITY